MADDYNMPVGELMKGKRGIITGVANHQSIAWGIASQLAAQGAEIAFLHLPGMERRVQPLADSIGVKVLAPVDVTDDAAMDAAFDVVKQAFGQIDFFVHAIAFANKDELKGSFVDNTTRDGFLRAMNISAFSFVDCARRAAELMPETGGSILTLTYMGSERAIPNYNTMGVAKAALEASVRYAARDLGPMRMKSHLQKVSRKKRKSFTFVIPIIQQEPISIKKNLMHLKNLKDYGIIFQDQLFNYL